MSDPTRALVSADQLAREDVGKGERSITSPHNSSSRTSAAIFRKLRNPRSRPPVPRNGPPAGARMCPDFVYIVNEVRPVLVEPAEGLAQRAFRVVFPSGLASFFPLDGSARSAPARPPLPYGHDRLA